MLNNISFALFGPSLTYGLKSLVFIQELSHVVLQLVHNIVGSELRESQCEGLKDNTNLSTIINGGPMYLCLMHQLIMFKTCSLTETPFFILAFM